MSIHLATSRGRSRSGPSTRTSSRRRSRWLGALAALALPLAVLVAPMAQASTTPPWTIGPDGAAEIDETGAINLPDLYGNVKELGPLNSNTTKIGVIHNDAVPTLGLTNPNAQVDLRQAWLNTAKDPSGDGDDWIYFAWERDANSGSGFIAFEFMKSAAPTACAFGPTQDDAALIANCNPWANRDGDSDGPGADTGDFMILWDQQGGSKDLWLRKWIGTAPALTLSAPELIPLAYGQAAYSADGFKGEAAINITDTIYGGVSQCLAFANIIPSTVTGNSDTADYKDTILRSGISLSNCTTTTTTTPQDSAGADIPAGGVSITTAGVVQVKDSALITLSGGTGTPGGTIDFTLCKASNAANATCDATGPSVLVDDNKAVSDADGAYPVTVVSSSAWVTSAGRYCWKAVYTGVPAAGIGGSSDVSTGECFVVNPVTPTLSTSAGDDVYLGSDVTDTATLGGPAPKPTAAVIHTSAPDPATRTAAGGTITFKLYGPSDTGCGAKFYDSSTEVPDEDADVSGNGNYNSASVTPTAPGNYHWVAVYSGDSPNTLDKTHNAACTDTNEDVLVKTVPSSVTTAQNWLPNDSATISATAGGDLNGTVKFNLWLGSGCNSGSAVYTENRTITDGDPAGTTVSTTNGSDPNNTYVVTASGSSTFSWSVEYDSDNLAQDDIGKTCKEVSTLNINNNYTPAP